MPSFDISYEYVIERPKVNGRVVAGANVTLGQVRDLQLRIAQEKRQRIEAERRAEADLRRAEADLRQCIEEVFKLRCWLFAASMAPHGDTVQQKVRRAATEIWSEVHAGRKSVSSSERIALISEYIEPLFPGHAAKTIRRYVGDAIPSTRTKSRRKRKRPSASKI